MKFSGAALDTSTFSHKKDSSAKKGANADILMLVQPDPKPAAKTTQLSHTPILRDTDNAWRVQKKNAMTLEYQN